ncbi:MAG TPA: molybdate ABC transporter substrate-binding protein [Nocardioidaceae bacterium]|nr:molybdate ABC transporter substrate-binding protein [Nocardioidaceae bacterium]
MRRAAALVILALAATACGGAGSGQDQQTLTVLAAASLTEPFTVLARTFEAEHDGLDVVTGFDSSATIATQVVGGASADVVATADPRTMGLMSDALDGDPVVFAHNTLALVVPPDNPARIDDVPDLQGTDFVVCAPAVPCGALAEDLLVDAGVTTRPRSLEVDVKAVLTKVMLGEADAGLVYASDVVAAGDRVLEVPLPDDARPATEYPAAVVDGSADPDLAREFVDLLLSDEGQQVLAETGFSGAEEQP